MSFLLTSNRCEEIAEHVFSRDYRDIPLDGLPKDWLINALANHLQALYNPQPTYLTDDDDENAEYDDPDEHLTKMLLEGIEGTITTIDVLNSPYRILKWGEQEVFFPCIFVDLYGVHLT